MVRWVGGVNFLMDELGAATVLSLEEAEGLEKALKVGGRGRGRGRVGGGGRRGGGKRNNSKQEWKITRSVCNVFDINVSLFRVPSFIFSDPSPFLQPYSRAVVLMTTYLWEHEHVLRALLGFRQKREWEEVRRTGKTRNKR